MPFTVAMTGATGFVGSHVVAKLAATPYALRVLARDPGLLPKPANLTAIKGDLADTAALSALCQGADTVLHVAGAVSGLTLNDYLRANLHGTQNLLQAAEAAGVRRFIHVSSLAAREPALSFYGNSKAQSETAVAAAKMQTLIFRPPAVYGEGDRATLPLLAALMSRTAILPGSPKASFSLIHVDDLSGILVAALQSGATGLRELDDGHNGYTWEQISAVTRGLFGRPQRSFYIPRTLAFAAGRLFDVMSSLRGRPGMISSDKMRQLYHDNWVAKPPGWPRDNPLAITEGMRRTLLWYMEKGLLPRIAEIDKGRDHDR